MRRAPVILLTCAAVLALGGCEATKKALGREKSAPDEFAVYSRAPLSLPPDFTLRPPAPGAERPQQVEARNEAQRALASAAGRPAPATTRIEGSPGTQAFLRQLGAENADPDIRQVINRETTILAAEDKSFTERLMFWGTPTAYGTVIDPAAEAKRIQDNRAMGRPVTEGETPTIARKRRALLEGIFN